MPTIRQIEEIFSPERIIAICEDEFGPLAEQIAFNIMTKRTNSGADVNALNVPEETTGATAESLKTIHEATMVDLRSHLSGAKASRISTKEVPHRMCKRSSAASRHSGTR